MQKIEGTYHLDGLLEGRLFSDKDEQTIRQFINDTKKEGLEFYLKMEQGSFSILPSQKVRALTNREMPVDSILKRLLEKFVSHYAPEENSQFMSTLRSVEYVKGFEKQVLYGIDGRGAVVVEKRMVPAETTPPQVELTLKQKIHFFGIVSSIVLVMFLISAIFVPYKQIAFSIIDSIKPYNLDKLTVSGQAYSDYFYLKEATINSKDQTLTLVFETTPSFPLTKEQLNGDWLLAEKEMEKRLVLEAISRQAVRCLLFDKEGKYTGQYVAAMIWTPDRSEFALVVPFYRTVEKIELRY